MHHMGAWYLRRPEEGIGCPGTGVSDCLKLPLGTSNWVLCKNNKGCCSPLSLFLANNISLYSLYNFIPLLLLLENPIASPYRSLLFIGSVQCAAPCGLGSHSMGPVECCMPLLQ